MDNYLLITALGKPDASILEQFTRAIKEGGGKIIESRMCSLGSEFSILMLLSGTWDAIAKIEDMLPRLESKLSMSIRTKRTEPAKDTGNLMPYAIDIVSIDNAGIVHDIVEFFSVNKISVQDIHANTYKAVNTGAPMMSLHMSINIPVDKSIASIRTDFMDFCDHQNLDAIMEPVK
jgi:glycine cleavage system transcriptional repressor